MPRWSRFVGIASAAALAAGSLWASAAEVFPLAPGGAERALPRGAVHAYPIDLRAGEYVHLKAEQLGVDVELRLLDPAGKLLLRIDSPNGDRGPEEFFFCAPQAGRYRAEVALRGSPTGGRYRLTVAARRQATAVDRRWAAALAALSSGGELNASHATEKAAAAYRRSADLWRGLGEESRRAEALRRLAEFRFSARALAAALPIYVETLKAYEAAGDRTSQAWTHNKIAICSEDLEQPDAARAAYKRALALWRIAGRKEEQAKVLHNLSVLDWKHGNYQESLQTLEQGLALWKGLGDSQGQAETLIDMGLVLASAGDPEAAEKRYQQAMALLKAPEGDRGLRAGALTNLANAYLDEDAPRSAVAPLQIALGLRRKTGDRWGEAVALASLGRVYFELRDPSRSIDHYRKALQLFQETGSRLEEAKVWNNLGWIWVLRGRARDALDAFQKALPVARSYRYRELEAAALHGMARAERRRGNPINARRWIEKALAIIESIRGDLQQTDLRLSYFAAKEDYYDFLIELLMEQHHLRPAEGNDLAAFVVSERARSRSLIDKIENHLENSRWPAAPPSLRDLQRLLGTDTLLLEYYLSEPKSYLWLVSADVLASYELPGRSLLESQVRFVQAALSRQRSGHDLAGTRLVELGRSLLGPVAGQLADKRLLIVPHGDLFSVPFAALSDPRSADGRSWAPLLIHHEIVVASSASLLPALRKRAALRLPAPEELGLVADPVSALDDPRLPAVARRAPSPFSGPFLPRLPFASQEAEAILRLLPARGILKAFGFDASRELVTGGRLARYRILHFATHGFFDEERPEMSALVLSRFDRAGKPRNGLVRGQDIWGLRLSADLVVLSACRTALGKHVAGEGLIGLTRGFLAAGASRVLVSLWNVDDRATAVLMERFYRGLFSDRRPPAAALRAAQLSMLQEERWGKPYLWAGFLLQGDWN